MKVFKYLKIHNDEKLRYKISSCCASRLLTKEEYNNIGGMSRTTDTPYEWIYLSMIVDKHKIDTSPGHRDEYEVRLMPDRYKVSGYGIAEKYFGKDFSMFLFPETVVNWIFEVTLYDGFLDG